MSRNDPIKIHRKTITLNDQELENLQRLCDKYGATYCAVVRQALRDLYDKHDLPVL